MRNFRKFEEMQERYMTIIDILERSKGEYVKAQSIADEMGIKLGTAQVSCNKLKQAGVIEAKECRGFRFVKRPKIGHLYIALRLPQLTTGNASADKAFRQYLEIQL